MRYAEVKQDIYRIPHELQQYFNGRKCISRNELLAVFTPIVRARRRGHYDEGRGILVTIEPRQVIEVPREYVRYLGD